MPKPDNKSVLTYRERANVMTRDARKLSCQAAGQSWEAYKVARLGKIAAREAEGQCRVNEINALRETGQHINVACGREQLLFTVHGGVFCQDELMPFLPADMLMSHIQACVIIATKMKAPAKTVADVDALEKLLKPQLVMLGLVQQAEREEQKRIIRNIFCEVQDMARRFELLLPDLDKIKPLDQWPRKELEQAVEMVLPIKKQIERMEELLRGKEK